MRNHGVHAGLALAGVVAGLPVAAVVQWRREPPAEVWSQIGLHVALGSDADEPFSVWHEFARSPGGPQVTSLRQGGGWIGTGAVHLTDLVQSPAVLVRFGMRVMRVAPKRRWTIDEGPVTDGVSGAVWHRIRLNKRP